ncbi:MAG TPA: hypothetical protein EYG19_01635, partial [Verrucomicrobia bacterium]|nr:hypothetical protein [Verrucomicrobiota bacterium]
MNSEESRKHYSLLTIHYSLLTTHSTRYTPSVPDIAANLAQVQQRIAAACDRAERSPDEVQIIAVGKKFTADVIREAADCGLTLFGENRVQEAKAKI